MTKTIRLSHGFLPDKDPLEKLPQVFSMWEAVANRLPKLLLANNFKQIILELPSFPMQALKNARQDERAMQILSYLGHAYVWGEKTVPKTLPAILAKPWFVLSQKLGRHPVLSYASYALNNWRRLNPEGPIELGNIALIQNFLGGVDEEWFILIHVDIEAKAISMLNACCDAIDSANTNDSKKLIAALTIIENKLKEICHTLERMPERCDPYIYYNRVRPYIHGWKNNDAFPQGLIYEGVTEYHGKPQQLRGETGAQSSIMPVLDAIFGITHANDLLHQYLLEMREYMPLKHRQFIEYVEKNSHVRKVVKKHMAEFPALRETYNHCIKLIEHFRQTHLGYASSYIQKQHQVSAENPNVVGTGGTPFMQYLKKHQDETITFLL